MSRGHRCWLATLGLVVLLLGFGGNPTLAQDDPPDPAPRPGAIGEPPLPLDQKRLYDAANLLDNTEEAQVESEATRLARFDLPSLIIVQASDMTRAQAATFAETVRSEWGVETTPGADDGLVMLVTVDLTDEKNVFSVMSWGENALPHFGINDVSAPHIQQAWLDAYLQEGMFFEAIDYSLRRLIYHSIYDPAPQEPLSNTRESVATLVSWLAPLAVLGGIALAVVSWRPPHRRRAGLELVATWGVPIAALAIAVLAVWTRSSIGVIAALVLLAIAVFGWVRRDPGVARDQTGVPPSAPGRVAS